MALDLNFLAPSVEEFKGGGIGLPLSLRLERSSELIMVITHWIFLWKG